MHIRFKRWHQYQSVAPKPRTFTHTSQISFSGEKQITICRHMISDEKGSSFEAFYILQHMNHTKSLWKNNGNLFLTLSLIKLHDSLLLPDDVILTSPPRSIHSKLGINHVVSSSRSSVHYELATLAVFSRSPTTSFVQSYLYKLMHLNHHYLTLLHRARKVLLSTSI